MRRLFRARSEATVESQRGGGRLLSADSFVVRLSSFVGLKSVAHLG